MIEKLLATMGLNPEVIKAQMESVMTTFRATAEHFDKKLSLIANDQTQMAAQLARIEAELAALRMGSIAIEGKLNRPPFKFIVPQDENGAFDPPGTLLNPAKENAEA